MTEEVVLKSEVDELVKEAYEKGIREVVSWCKENHSPIFPSAYPYPGLVIISEAKLEAKWGVEKGQ